MVAVAGMTQLNQLTIKRLLLKPMQGTQILDKHLPAGCAPDFMQWFVNHKARLTITRPRQNKLGDFRPANLTKPHRISVNGNLNSYAFAITLVHEMAHLVAWQQHKDKISPHGEEWKKAFGELAQKMLINRLPNDVEQALNAVFNMKKRSRAASENLARVLRSYDQPSALVEIETLADGSTFGFRNGRIFKKIEKAKKRFRCLNMHNNRYYLFSPLALVEPIKE